MIARTARKSKGALPEVTNYAFVIHDLFT